MFDLSEHPVLVFVVSLPVFWISARVGASFHKRNLKPEERRRNDFTFITGATLTLLGLIIGFSFSMAVSRYEQRKIYEEQEANAIGTEYVRADLLASADAAKVRTLLKSYLEQRIFYYKSRDAQEGRQIDAETARLQNEMWSAVATWAAAHPTPLASLVAAGMNDVLNSQGYTQAAWWNPIPIGAWVLLIVISVFCNLLVGYLAEGEGAFMLLILPIALSISLFLIADIDSPRHGVIRVHPRNLESLAQSLNSQ
jgi:hypothetical protein